MKHIDTQLLNGEHIIKVIPISRRGTYAEAFMMTVPLLAWASAVFVVDSGVLSATYIQGLIQQITGLSVSENFASIIPAIVFALAIKLITGKGLIELIFTSLLSVIFAPLYIINRIFGNERALTNLRLIQKTGIIKTEFWDNTTERIQRSTYQQNLLGKLLNYGTVIVVDVFDAEQSLNLVNKPAEITKLLNSNAGRRSFTKAPTEEVLLPGEQAHNQLDDRHVVAHQLSEHD